MRLAAPGRYAISLALLLAVGLRWLLNPVLGDYVPFITVLTAVGLSGWGQGTGRQ
jgi:hypothetical protein